MDDAMARAVDIGEEDVSFIFLIVFDPFFSLVYDDS